MAEVVMRPVFDEQEFEKLRTQILTGLAVQAQNPQYIVEKEFRKQMYGDHPYSRTVAGEPEDVQALTPMDVQEFWQWYAVPKDAALIFAGDIEAGEAFDLAEKHFGKWWNRYSVKMPLPGIPQIEGRKIVLVDKPGSAQCQIRVGQHGFTRHQQPDYFVSRIVGNYFGGSFNARLMDTIRVQKGLTYGAYGGWAAYKRAGEFKIRTFTKTEALGETLQTIFDEIDRLRNEPPSNKELNETKTYIAGSFVRARETPQSIAGDLWLIESQELEPDYLQRLLDKVGNATKQECMDLIQRSVDPDNMIVVVTGDASEIEETLSAFGPVTVIREENTAVSMK
jgi:zinc protease